MSRRRTGFPPEVVELVTARSGGNCEIMSTGCIYQASQLHHRRCRGMGSTKRPETNAASNCLHLCERCHAKVEAMRAWALDNGFLVLQSQDPRSQPVWWRCAESGGLKTMVLLDDSGIKVTVPVRRTA